MIIRRYGSRFHSVALDFDPAAMTEVGFRRDGEQEWDAEEFLAGHHLVREEEVIAESTDAGPGSCGAYHARVPEGEGPRNP